MAHRCYILIQSGDESFYKARSQWISDDGTRAVVVESGRYYVIDTHTARIKAMYRDKQSAINYALLEARTPLDCTPIEARTPIDYEQRVFVKECYEKFFGKESESYRKVYVNE